MEFPIHERAERWMDQALAEAQRAFEEGEVPVGCVIVQGDRVIGRGRNSVERLQDATAHAEILAISAAAGTLGTWRLTDCELFVTLEPCTMCIGAIHLARISRVVFGATDPKFGACGSILDVPAEPRWNHSVEVVGGVRAEISAQLMRDFFRRLRH